MLKILRFKSIFNQFIFCCNPSRTSIYFSGKPTRALDTLYDVIKSKKRNHQYSEKLIEQIMNKYLELCVDLKKSHVAKEGLFQYRNMCQATNVASLASVVQGYLSMAEKRFVFLLTLCRIFGIEIKVRKFQKQIFLLSFPPKNQRIFF